MFGRRRGDTTTRIEALKRQAITDLSTSSAHFKGNVGWKISHDQATQDHCPDDIVEAADTVRLAYLALDRALIRLTGTCNKHLRNT